MRMLFAVLFLTCVSLAKAGGTTVDFGRDVKPIFENHCYECHGPTKRESGYRLDQRGDAMRGGDFGESPIVAGDAVQSPLFRFVNGDDADAVMPPKEGGKPRLSAAELETLRAWIDQGADWPDEYSGETKSSDLHWSLRPLVLPVVPNNELNPIDAFVNTKLAEAGLASSPEADRRTLIRRLSYDLIGLPPTPEEIDAFVSDESSGSLDSLVDRLLATPQYGERWGRHWLDVARYSESQGFEYDRLRDNAWHYRDYVIKSFNDDKPYDRFVTEQIAGDVLEPVTTEGIVATSLLVCGPWDQAGNAQSNQTQRAITREDELEDMIGVVGQTFLGLTINCARCHSHKFDPIPHHEYYRINSVFSGVKHGERSIESAEETKTRNEHKQRLQAEYERAAELVTSIESVGAELVASTKPTGDRRVGPAPFARWTFHGGAVGDVMPGNLHGGATINNERLQLVKQGAFFKTSALPKDIGAKTIEAWVSLATLDQGGGAPISIETGDGRMFDAIVFGERQQRKWIAGSEGFARTKDLERSEETSASGEFVHVAISYHANNSISLYRNGEPLGTPYTPASPLQIFAAGDAHILLGQRHTGGGRPWLTGEIKQASLYDRALDDAEVAASFLAGGNSISQTEMLAMLTTQQRETHAAATLEKQRLQKSLDALKADAGPKSYAGVRIQPEPTKRLKRGDVTTPDEVVTPGALAAISDLESDFGLAADAPEAQRRLMFAEWLCDARNPLPARVMANRVWHLHFGKGLVATPNDFGVSGARPTHPELLDWLAVKFIEGGWSVKSLHRLIVSSATYRQSAGFNERAATIDADNELLWRFTPRRLEAEAVRDGMLFASGQLNKTVGGASFRPFTTTEFNATFYTPVDRAEPEFNRRTVYRINVNSGKDPLLDSFDCPDPSVKTPRRGVTTTPLQALELMNHSFVQRQAKHLADRAIVAAGGDVDDAIRTAYLFSLGRTPTDDERARAAMAANERGLASVCWALLNSTEFIYVQ